MYCLFHIANLFLTLSSTPSHTRQHCCGHLLIITNIVGRFSILQPNSYTSTSSSLHYPPQLLSAFYKFIFNLNAASNNSNSILRVSNCSLESLKMTKVSSTKRRCVICTSFLTSENLELLKLLIAWISQFSSKEKVHV